MSFIWIFWLQSYVESDFDSEDEEDAYYSFDDGEIDDLDDPFYDAEEKINCETTPDEQDAVFNEESEIVKWIIECGILQSHVDKLLNILRHRLLPSLPKTCKTLLKTDAAYYEIEKVGNGEFVYFGIEKGLQNLNHNLHQGTIELIINIDGVPAFKSGSKQRWPILGKVHHQQYDIYEPFPIGIFYGDEKPSDIDRFLEKFVEEVNELSKGFEIEGKNYKLCIKSFCCDTPARALLKGVKGHIGFFSCERCIIKGERHNKTTIFPFKQHEKRTDTSFRNEKQPKHHNYTSPLLKIPQINMITCFVLDFMHLCCMGVMKKLLGYWLQNVSFKLSSRKKLVLEERSENMATQVPVEYQRKTRSLLQHYSKLKATEFRFFLL